MDRREVDLLFRWFVGLGVDDPAWDHSTFSKNRDRLLAGDIAAKFLAAVLDQPRVKRLLSNEHFSVGGTLIAACSIFTFGELAIVFRRAALAVREFQETIRQHSSLDF